MAQNKLSRNKRTESAKNTAAAQRARTEANKLRKIAKHLKAQPNDSQSRATLESLR